MVNIKQHPSFLKSSAEYDWAYDIYKQIKDARERGQTEFLDHPIRGAKCSRCGAPHTFLEVIYPIARTETQIELYECLNPKCRHATTVRPNLSENLTDFIEGELH